MELVKAFIHVNGFLCSHGDSSSSSLSFYPREISIAATDFPDMIYTLLVQDADFKITPNCCLAMYGNQKLKRVLPMDVGTEQVVSQSDVPGLVKEYLARLQAKYESRNPLIVAVFGNGTSRFLRQVCDIPDPLDTSDFFRSLSGNMRLTLDHILDYYPQPYDHDTLVHEETTSMCSTRLAWKCARYIQYYYVTQVFKDIVQ